MGTVARIKLRHIARGGKILFALMALICAGCGQKTESLQQLGLGEFAAPPDVVTIKILGYKPQVGKAYQNLFVSNFSVKAQKGTLTLSTARDGMPDALKQSLNAKYGFTIDSAESSAPGFADLMLFDAGLTLAQQSLLFCSSNQQISSSNDAVVYNDDRQAGNPVRFLGLRDCDKVYMGLNPQAFNFSGDGIPDYLKMRCGLNPLSKTDAFISTAGDGVLNIDKCKRNIPIDESAYTQPNQLFSYQYNTIVNQDGSRDFTISNIPVLNTGDENFIAFYLTEIDLSNNAPALYTAFAILKAGYAGKTLQINYWATDASKFFNQEIVVP